MPPLRSAPSLAPARCRCYSAHVTLESFEESLTGTTPPAGLAPAVRALWHERRGDWDQAHAIAQDDAGRDGAWVHAYLHRREGDRSNAAYWYRQAGRPVAHGNLDEEWQAIVRTLLSGS